MLIFFFYLRHIPHVAYQQWTVGMECLTTQLNIISHNIISELLAECFISNRCLFGTAKPRRSPSFRRWISLIPLCFSFSSSPLLSVRDSCWVAFAVGTAQDPTSARCSCPEMWISSPTNWLCPPWSLPSSRPKQKRYSRVKTPEFLSLPLLSLCLPMTLRCFTWILRCMSTAEQRSFSDTC